MSQLIFLKLGGSLITDKTGQEQLRADALDRVAAEIAAARAAHDSLRLVLGHGSGSFGHVAAARYRTRDGVRTAAEWQGFAAVADAAARLNRAVIAALLRAGVPAMAFAPSAAASCRDGQVLDMPIAPGIGAALAAGLVPVVYGDVAFDEKRGGTIISTEEVMSYLAGPLQPDWLLLTGETAGVYDVDGTMIRRITPGTFDAVLPALGGSRGTDVTGGMATKVRLLLDLTARHPGLRARIFNGLEPGALAALLADPAAEIGTLVQSD